MCSLVKEKQAKSDHTIVSLPLKRLNPLNGQLIIVVGLTNRRYR